MRVPLLVLETTFGCPAAYVGKTLLAIADDLEQPKDGTLAIGEATIVSLAKWLEINSGWDSTTVHIVLRLVSVALAKHAEKFVTATKDEELIPFRLCCDDTSNVYWTGGPGIFSVDDLAFSQTKQFPAMTTKIIDVNVLLAIILAQVEQVNVDVDPTRQPDIVQSGPS